MKIEKLINLDLLTQFFNNLKTYLVNNFSNSISIEYSELVTLRDSGELIPGMQYRITDFVTTTATTITNATSAGHQFDVIVTASSNNTFNEDAKAALHANDTYFANCEIDSWELKYCIDNDTDRFEWADNSENGNGKGVIYYMKDNGGNECQYDFKNIMFKNPLNADDATWYFTFTHIDGSDASLWVSSCYENKIDGYYSGLQLKLNNIIFDCMYGRRTSIYNNVFGCNCYNNTFKYSCYNNTFGNNCYNNAFGNNCYNNKFGVFCSGNKFGYSCYNNTFGNDCYYNEFGDACYNNIFGYGFSNNIFEYNFYYNNFGCECRNNNFGGNNKYNVFGNKCIENTFGNNCTNNTFGDDCTDNTFGDDCTDNTFGNSCTVNTLGANFNRNTFGDDCTDNTFGDDCTDNTFGDSCITNEFGASCTMNEFATGCSNNTFGASCSKNIFKDNCKNNSFVDSCIMNEFATGCSNNTLTSSSGIILGFECTNNTFNSAGGITLGDACIENSFGMLSMYNIFGSQCSNNAFGMFCNYNTFGNNCTGNEFNRCSRNTFGCSCQSNNFNGANDNKLENGCCYISIDGGSQYNVFEKNCQNITIGQGCFNNIFETGCSNIAFETITGDGMCYFKNIKFESGCTYITIFEDTPVDETNPVYAQNYVFMNSMSGLSDRIQTHTVKRGLTHNTTVERDSYHQAKEYCKADTRNAYDIVNVDTREAPRYRIEIKPNTMYVIPELQELTITYADIMENVAKEYVFQFVSGSTATTLIMPLSTLWANGNAPVIKPNAVYQISVLNDLATALEFPMP